MLQSASKTPGAGKWFTKSPEFKTWRDGEARKFFAYGKLGTGKSVLMLAMKTSRSFFNPTPPEPGPFLPLCPTTNLPLHIQHIFHLYSLNYLVLPNICMNRSLVIDKLLSKSRVCIYAFLDSSNGETQNITNLLSTLLIQLLNCGKEICDTIKEKYEELNSSRFKPTTKVYLAMLRSQMEFLASRKKRIFLVVDALDQCDDETLTMFLNACDEFPSSVHMLFASTRYNGLGDLIKPDKSLEIFAQSQDIRSYLNEAFARSPRLQGALKDRDPSFKDHVLSIVVQKSLKNFLLATLHLEKLLSVARLYPLESCLEGLSETPDEFYKEALARSKQDSSFIGKVIPWLVFVERPITVDELAHAMQIRSQIEDIKSGRCLLPRGKTLPSFRLELDSSCAGILEVDDEDRVKFRHFTAKLYLINNEAEMLSGGQTMITDVCLASLRHAPLEASAQSIPSAEALLGRCRKYPFLKYAADHWGHHLLFKEKGKYAINLSAWDFLTDAKKLRNATQIMSNFEFRKEQGVTGMHVAAYFGLVELTRKARKNNRSLEIDACTRSRRETVLHWAVTYQQHDFVEFLVEAGARLKAQDSNGRTALYVAVAMKDLASIETLLSPKQSEREQYIDLAQSLQGWAPLHCAIDHGKSQIVEKLLNAGAKVNTADKDGFTPLCLAAQLGHLKIVELLVHKKASLELTYPSGKRWSLLEWAAAEGRTTVIRLLIEKSVDLDTSVTEDGKTPLRLAVEYGNGMITWLLIDAHVDIDKPDNEGKTPLYWAAEHCQLSAMWLLLENKANTMAGPNQADKMTPLHIAALKGHESAVLLLLTMGADPYQLDINSHTALYWAIVEGHKAVVQLLLLKADAQRLVREGDNEDRTALHHAACQGHLEVTDLLVRFGADVNAKDVDGNTALQLASNLGNDEICGYLLGLGSDVRVKSWDSMTSEGELQGGPASNLADSIEAEMSLSDELIRAEEPDRRWSEEVRTENNEAETLGRFRARVEDDYEDEWY